MTFAILPFADYEGNMRLTIFNSDCNGGITVAFATKQYIQILLEGIVAVVTRK